MIVVLVTGAKGALGQSVVAYFRKNCLYNVIATSRHDEDDLQLDVCNRNQLTTAIKNIRPDLVLHLAATFANDFDEAYAVNVEATRHLLELVQQSGYSTRVLLVGSAAEYGVVQPEENPVCEERVLKPVSIYGLTKTWQTQMAGFYASRGVDVVVARAFNLYGPRLSERLFIGRLQNQIDAVLAGQSSVIEIGPLTAIRDYVSIDEAAYQIFAIAAHGESGRVYHVASGRPVTMRDILHRYLATHELDASIVHEAPHLTNRVGYDVPAIYADMSRTMKLVRSRKVRGDA